ncbi:MULTISPECIES: exonuclease SbcCD subunit D [unclassified Agarivorans]|uniref:exonuclease SbcCD subunit D n=1 Tax=unclassified Agarivorans TaxID=2636026 RepID=UPI0026E138AC|nr:MULTISPECIES: exonuclease SbcCD subunit D [unclassified Agarivorans]MDO6684858.1 exonuclease SbcCD subunit D [Agarivorans sp. 3_MG-2023]MDO6714981.1 exonuclease SbcCD subunit D [Agarivorans sp. 2_MG-2023]
MKFLHTSDWHLGRQLHNQSLLEDQAFVLEQIVSLAKQHDVDALIVAGDIFDRSVPPSQAVALLDEVLHQLVNELAISVIMIAGNHDGAQRLAFASRHMQNLHIVGPLKNQIKPIMIKSKAGENTAFYGLPYAEPATVREVFDCEVSSHQQAMQVLLEQVSEHDSQTANKVVIAHCFLDGGDESESERPLSIGGADKISPNLFTPFSYAALGHLHGPQYKGESHVRYSGSPLKYSFSEQHQNKSITLVELNGDDYQFELLPLKPLRDVRIIEGMLDDVINAGATDINNSDYLMVRLLDKSAILDAMGKLRDVYPNVLHLERTGLMAENQQLALHREHVQKGEYDMFSDFFSQVSGENLSDEQQSLLKATIESLHTGDQ